MFHVITVALLLVTMIVGRSSFTLLNQRQGTLKFASCYRQFCSPCQSSSSTVHKSNNQEFVLTSNASGELSLSKTATSQREKPFLIDYTSSAFQLRLRRSKTELVVKALGRAKTVVDCTAGLGRDSMMLAAAGKSVVMVEENKILHSLIVQALHQFSNKGSEQKDIAQRIRLLHGDARELKREIEDAVNNFGNGESVAVYLDPMYPEKPDSRTALVKKDTQWLHILAKQYLDPMEEEEYLSGLFSFAKEIATERIVVKRGLHAPYLLPSLVPRSKIAGKAQRFDIYPNHH